MYTVRNDTINLWNQSCISTIFPHNCGTSWLLSSADKNKSAISFGVCTFACYCVHINLPCRMKNLHNSIIISEMIYDYQKSNYAHLEHASMFDHFNQSHFSFVWEHTEMLKTLTWIIATVTFARNVRALMHVTEIHAIRNNYWHASPKYSHRDVRGHIWFISWPVRVWLVLTGGPFDLHGLTLIPARISNYIQYKGWDEITYPFLNFNGATVEV